MTIFSTIFTNNFIVIDTEGIDELKEIAIIDSEGKLIYEAFNQNLSDNSPNKKLENILREFYNFAKNKIIICHSANHDETILAKNFKRLTEKKVSLKFDCTLKLSKQYFPDLDGYSLADISRQLNLKVNHQYFNPNEAHTAQYDARFTYQLYLKIREKQLQITLKDKPNPFISNRVDTPFQNHLDLRDIYQPQFNLIKSIISEIKNDLNHQTKGVVVIGQPGTGKTHLMMRLAQDILITNRLLFIRQPNNAETIIYHIYSRMLESFIEVIPNTNYTQLESFLSYSFSAIIQQENNNIELTNKDKELLNIISNNPLNLYQNLGAEGTQKKREYWLYIEKKAKEWLSNTYGIAGYTLEILKGLIKYCSYSDKNRKELVTRWLAGNELKDDELLLVGLDDWNTEISKESFALEAISVFSKLSILDQPLVIVFDQLEGLGLEQNKSILLKFGDAIKEIFTHIPNSLIILNLFPDKWQQFQEIFDASIIDRISQHQINLIRPSDQKIKDILNLKCQEIGINIDILFTPDQLTNILNNNSIRKVLNTAYNYYQHKINGLSLQNESFLPENDPIINSTLEERVIKIEQQINQLQEIFYNLNQVFNNINFAKISSVSANKIKPNFNINNSEESEVTNHLQRQKILIEEKYPKNQIIDDHDDIGKLKIIAENLQNAFDFKFDYLRLGKKSLPQHLLISKQKKQICIGFININGTAFASRIKNYNELIINNKTIKFILFRDQRLPNITGIGGKNEIDKLNNSNNGLFQIMGKDERIDFELLYQLIIDIQNKDLEIELNKALFIANSYLKNSWIIKLLS